MHTMVFSHSRILKSVFFVPIVVVILGTSATGGEIASLTGTDQHFSNFYNVYVSEFTPLGSTVFIFNVCTDSKADRLTFSVSDKHFRVGVHGCSARIYTAVQLDYEVRNNYILDITITDHGSISPTDRLVRVNITVIDENDNGPQFGRNIYHVRVLENVEVGTVIAQLSATDADSIHDNDIRYKILSTVPVDGIGMFTIDPVRGTVTTSAPLFSVTTRTFNITVQAYESKTEFTTTQLLVFVDAINLHQPIFQGTVNNTYYISVLEMVPVGTVVTRVHATDEDSSQNGEVHYYMVPPISPDLPFSISDDGTISTKATLDRETMNVYQFRVGATDQGIPVRLHNTAIVRVRILDVNNNAPMFSKSTYSATLPTPTAAGQSVIRIQAVDSDSGQNAQLRYHVKDVSPTNCSGLFAIDALSGEIKTAKSSDAGHQMKCTLTVTASDDGIVRLVSETKVHINIVSKPSTDAIGNPFG